MESNRRKPVPLLKVIGKYSVFALFLASFSGCQILYIPDTQQGNLVTQEMVDRLKKGMTENQVKFVLGTPLVRDPFHARRWDYVYTFSKGGSNKVERRRLTVYFKNKKLDRFEVESIKKKEAENVS